MTVRARTGRNRYIVFRVEPSTVVRRDIQGAVLGVLSRHGGTGQTARKPALILYGEGFGIVRVPHTVKEEAIGSLSSIKWTGRGRARAVVSTIGTSGTIRGAVRFLPREVRAVSKGPPPEAGGGAPRRGRKRPP